MFLGSTKNYEAVQNITKHGTQRYGIHRGGDVSKKKPKREEAEMAKREINTTGDINILRMKLYGRINDHSESVSVPDSKDQRIDLFAFD